MTSQYRHRRSSDPTKNFPNPIEPGEIAVNTANRQLTVGDAAAVGTGAPLPLLPIRFFDSRAIYATGDLVVYTQNVYRALAGTGPGAFVPAKWETLVGELSPEGFVLRSGDTMEGPLHLHAEPTASMEAANKGYVDQWLGTKSTLFISESPPTDVPDNALWWDSSASDLGGSLYVRYNDGNSTAWVAAVPMPDLSQFVLKEGDHIDGPLILGRHPVDPMEAATKGYVDDGDAISQAMAAGKVNRAGDTMTGALTVSPHIMTAYGPNGGTIYFGTSGARYITNDGTGFHTTGGITVNGDIYAHRGNGTGVVYLNGPSANRYIHWDGGRYQLPGGPTGIGEPAAGGDAATVNYVNGRTPVVMNYTAVQQSGGAYQGANKVYIGWDGGGLRAQVDATDLGRISFGSGVVSSLQWVHAGDRTTIDGGAMQFIEIANASITGHASNWAAGYPIPAVFRYRHLQVYTTGWYTVGWAS